MRHRPPASTPDAGRRASGGRAPPPFVAHCVDLLAPLGHVQARSMFGGHGLWLDGVFIAIVVGERLYLKTDAASQARFAAAGCEPFVYHAAGRTVQLSYWSAPAEAMETAATMRDWARLAWQAALHARAARPRRTARAGPDR